MPGWGSRWRLEHRRTLAVRTARGVWAAPKRGHQWKQRMGALSRWQRSFEFPTSPPQRAVFGFDHGVGHPLLLLCNAKAHNHRKSEGFKHLDNYSEWPKVADVVIEAVWNTPNKEYLKLKETLTGSVVRLQTSDQMLSETFWNHYHNRDFALRG